MALLNDSDDRIEFLECSLKDALSEVRLAKSRNNLLGIQIDGFKAALENSGFAFKEVQKEINDRDLKIKELEAEIKRLS